MLLQASLSSYSCSTQLSSRIPNLRIRADGIRHGGFVWCLRTLISPFSGIFLDHRPCVNRSLFHQAPEGADKIPLKSLRTNSWHCKGLIVDADARIVGRKWEAALSVSNHVKSQSCDLFIRMRKLDAREKKALSSTYVLLESEGRGRIA